MDRCISAGISAALLALFVNLFVYLYFVPPFVAAILFIYTARLQTLREGLVTSLMAFVISDGILNTLSNAIYFLSTSEPYMLVVDIWIVIIPISTAIAALLAGYVGVRLARTLKPTREMPSQSLPPPLPPV